MKPTITIRLKKPMMILVVAACLLMQIIDPSPIWQTLLVVLIGAWIFSWLWIRSLASGLVFSRQIRYGWKQVGDRLEERFSLAQKSWAPALWVEVQDLSDLPDHQSGRIASVESRGETNWKIGSLCVRRGIYTLGPTRLHTMDPLGLYAITLDDPNSRSIMVAPPILSLPGIQIAPGGRSGDGRPKPNFLERSSSAAGVRAYSPGDSLHLIHWRTTARRESLYVHLFDGTPAGDWRIVVDLYQQVQAGSGSESTEEHGIILAASLLDRALRQRQPAGLLINGAPFTWIPPHLGESQRWQGLRALALAHSGSVPLGEMLQRVGSEIPYRSSLVLITPDISLDWMPSVLRLLQRGIVPSVLLLDTDAYHQKSLSSPGENRGVSVEQSTNTQAAVAELARHGIYHVLITPELLDQPEARPGQAGSWEWLVAGPGRAVAVRRPSDLNWKSL